MKRALAFAAALTLSASTIRTPRERSFSFEYAVTVKDVPPTAKTIDLWVPVPHDDPYQRITDLKFETPYPYKIATDADGNPLIAEHAHVRMAAAASNDGAEMLRGGATAPADHADAVFGDEAGVVSSQLLGGQVVMHAALHDGGQAGIG